MTSTPLTVGSGADCGLRLQVEGVEEEHASVRLEGDRVLMQSNVAGERDARVNGVAAHAAALADGDTVSFGNVEATFELGDDAPLLRTADTTHELMRGVNAIGRDPGTGVVLGDESVSRKHAAIFILPSGQVVLRDLGSANGTMHKGRRLGEIELDAGDEIRIGDAVLHLRRHAEAPSDSPPPAGAEAAKTVVGGRPAGAAPSVADAAAMPKLELEFRGAKRTLEDGTLRIGRAPDCELVIGDDAQVSRHHAELRVAGGRAVLRDLGSSNGTRVNGAGIAGERLLADGDRIGIGGQELAFSADVPVTPFSQTVVAGELPGASDRTMAAPREGGLGAGVAAAGVGIVPGDRESALLALDLPTDAAPDQIQRRYRELYSEFQIRLTNAPTQDLKATYERRLNELRAAGGVLLPQLAAGASEDLPALEPVAADPEPAPAVGGPEPAISATPVPDGAPPAGAATAADRAGAGKKRLPRSTLVMALIGALLIAAVVFCAVGSVRAGAATAELRAERDAKRKELRRVEAAIPRTTAAVESLERTKGALLTNADLKICNHSSGALEWAWLNAAWFDDEAGEFSSFDTATDTEYQYLNGETIAPGDTFADGEWVVGQHRVWPGQAIFFAAQFYYDGAYVLRAGATPDLEGGCFPLNLDR